MNDLEHITEEVRQRLATLRLDGTAQEFINQLDRSFDEIYSEAVARFYVAPPWDMPGVQSAICCYLAWGEMRSVETFTLQATQLGFARPRLRLLLSKQIYEEMVHHQMFREAAIKMVGVDPLNVSQPAAIMEMFESYDNALGTGDVIEKIFYAQFCSERAVIPSFKRLRESAQASRQGLHPLMDRAFSKALSDEPGHVAVGRIAAMELAERGAHQRQRMVEMAISIIAITVNLWRKGSKNLPDIIRFGASLLIAKTTARWKPANLEESSVGGFAV